ncbi:orotidine-5'-phosphate decarboxylase [Crocosphaera watsonii WH 8501]|uniref:Orotidine 5'-phosphate decarboxylase n=4 Tax=Crocosphaera watsonii TaxID=263511 RepID=Q4C3E0_CROWT|nr:MULTISPECIES: orotidine-5'-phosphate decarboxylase [Crocosphaera]EAM50685.1 Orotidine 5'-phosphate decarboxylase [Crocosphaera watsonii WH 8501]EHJ12576.1 Orotidine 5'-phosphate decarboxylase [Crocosphaera watsonii WH 0003]MCH2244578.1 orotidine-5'-phosphate decarboxylase [Crocosphaera sp.]NQZ64908.1 orotidine-5'-phosphate decarboxylase [Crocosphaera sp.]CCQ56538.1 Orotidine 5'-phosphate decarboxylase [Crocosphaera watsonii WH 0005]
MSVADQIIVPLDVPTEEAAIALLDRLPQVSFWKVGLELFVATGPTILKHLKERKKKIFLDLKFHDIPNTVMGACRSASRYEVDLLTLHATAGKNALKAAREAIAHSASPPQLLAITLLTSLNARDLAFDLKIPLELPEYALQMALLAKDCGINGAVCSPQEVAQLRAVCGKDFVLVCPGVRPSWGQTGDQQRVMTPKQALDAGANYLVIGRPITMSDDPVMAWNRIVDEVSS